MSYMRVNVGRVPQEIMYLVIIDQMVKRHRDLIVERPDKRFDIMVQKLAMTHIVDGDEPPEEIRTAVMNVADDIMAERDVTLRAGDYIALMNYARENKLV